MSTFIKTLNYLLTVDKYKELFSLIKGIRNGIAYGTKIRFPHALVMTFLFKDGTLQEKFKIILKATYQHGRNLACFTLLYKFLINVLSKMSGRQLSVHGGQKTPWHVISAAAVTGYLVFGTNNPINTQINMYLLSRILFGLARLGSEKGYLPSSDLKKGGRDWFPLFGAVMWGTVLYLFEFHRHHLQPSLQASMTYLYDDSEVWHSVYDFIVVNKLPGK